VTTGKPVELTVIFDGTKIISRPPPRLAPLSMPPPPKQKLDSRR